MGTRSMLQTRWAAVGAAVAITLGAGGIGVTNALTGSGERAIFVPIDPCRLAATRPAPDTVGPRTAGLGPADTYTIDAWGAQGNCTLPSGTAALALNVTAVGATRQTNLRFFPAGAPAPTTASLNPTPGAPPTPNAVTVGLNSAGQFSVFNAFGTVAIIIDVVGVYDDHHHDDRYYTQEQVDEMVDTASDDVWGYVTSSGGIHASSGNFTVTRPATGQYCIVIARRSSYKATQVSLADPGGTKIVSVGTGHGSACNPLSTATEDAVPVYIRTTDGAYVDGNFTFVVPAP